MSTEIISQIRIETHPYWYLIYSDNKTAISFLLFGFAVAAILKLFKYFDILDTQELLKHIVSEVVALVTNSNDHILKLDALATTFAFFLAVIFMASGNMLDDLLNFQSNSGHASLIMPIVYALMCVIVPLGSMWICTIRGPRP